MNVTGSSEQTNTTNRSTTIETTALPNSLYPEEKSSSHIFITRVSFANWSWAPTLPQNWEGCYVSWLNFQEKVLSSVRTALGKQTGERLLKWFLAQWCRGKRLQAHVSGMLSEKGEVLCGSVGGEGGWRPGGVQKLLHIYTSWGKCQDLVGHFLRLVHFKCLRNYSYQSSWRSSSSSGSIPKSVAFIP